MVALFEDYHTRGLRLQDWDGLGSTAWDDLPHATASLLTLLLPLVNPTLLGAHLRPLPVGFGLEVVRVAAVATGHLGPVSLAFPEDVSSITAVTLYHLLVELGRNLGDTFLLSHLLEEDSSLSLASRHVQNQIFICRD